MFSFENFHRSTLSFKAGPVIITLLTIKYIIKIFRLLEYNCMMVDQSNIG